MLVHLSTTPGWYLAHFHFPKLEAGGGWLLAGLFLEEFTKQKQKSKGNLAHQQAPRQWATLLTLLLVCARALLCAFCVCCAGALGSLAVLAACALCFRQASSRSVLDWRLSFSQQAGSG